MDFVDEVDAVVLLAGATDLPVEEEALLVGTAPDFEEDAAWLVFEAAPFPADEESEPPALMGILGASFLGLSAAPEVLEPEVAAADFESAVSADVTESPAAAEPSAFCTCPLPEALHTASIFRSEEEARSPLSLGRSILRKTNSLLRLRNQILCSMLRSLCLSKQTFSCFGMSHRGQSWSS